jgi:tetrahydromethanopterin S-methyltransferase subunit B
MRRDNENTYFRRGQNENRHLEERVEQLEVYVEELMRDLDYRWSNLPVDGYQGMEDEDEDTR